MFFFSILYLEIKELRTTIFKGLHNKSCISLLFYSLNSLLFGREYLIQNTALLVLCSFSNLVFHLPAIQAAQALVAFSITSTFRFQLSIPLCTVPYKLGYVSNAKLALIMIRVYLLFLNILLLNSSNCKFDGKLIHSSKFLLF